MSNIKRCYNVAATLFGNISPTFAQSCHSTLWQRSRNFPGLRFHNFHSMLWKRCYNLKLLAGVFIITLMGNLHAGGHADRGTLIPSTPVIYNYATVGERAARTVTVYNQCTCMWR